MHNAIRILSLVFLSLVLGACGGGGDDGGDGITTGSVDLGWDVPTERHDGASLTANEVSGYRILMSKNNAAFSEVVDINANDAGTTPTYTISNLGAGDYRFVVVTYDTNGDESPYSNIISTAFQ